MPTCAGTERGLYTRILIDFESSFLGAGSGQGIILPFLTETLTRNRDLEQDESINGRKDMSEPYEGRTNVSGEITGPVDENNFGWIVRWLFGTSAAPVDNGDGTFTHVWKINHAACNPSCIVEVQHTEIPAFYRYTGCKISTFALSINDGGQLQYTIGIEGANRTIEGTEYDDTPTILEKVLFNHNDATLEEGGAAFADATELSISIDTQLSTDLYTIGNDGARGALPEGKFDIGGTLSALFDDLTLQNKAVNGTETSLKTRFSNGGSPAHFLDIFFPEVRYSENDPAIEGPAGVLQELDYIAYFGDSAEDSSIVITIQNTVASYNV